VKNGGDILGYNLDGIGIYNANFAFDHRILGSGGSRWTKGSWDGVV